MNKFVNSMINALNAGGELASKHLPMILNVVGTGLFGLTVYEAVKTTSDKKEELKEATDEATKVEKAKVYLKTYAKPIIYGAGTLACFYGAQSINTKRIVTLASLYSIEKNALDDYISATKDVVGKNKAEKIRTKADEKSLDRYLDGKELDSMSIQNSKYGTDFFYIPATGKLFRSDMEFVKQAFDRCSDYLQNNDWCSYNRLMIELGLDCIGVGETIGWDAEAIFNKNGHSIAKLRIPVEFDSCLRFGKPVVVIHIRPEGMLDWRNWDSYDNQYAYPPESSDIWM